MSEETSAYDLEERTFQFALSIRRCISKTQWKKEQWTDVDQLLRSSGSVAANYIEANNAISKPDFLHRLRISKKRPAKANSGCVFWGKLPQKNHSNQSSETSTRNPTN